MVSARCCYELLSGYPPSYGDGKLAATTGKTTAALPASVPEPLARLVARLLAESPADRPADMESVERELAAVLAAPPTAPIEPVKQLRSHPIRVEPPSIRRRRRKASRCAANGNARRTQRRRRRGIAAAGISVAVSAPLRSCSAGRGCRRVLRAAALVREGAAGPLCTGCIVGAGEASRRKKKRRKSTSLRSRAPSRTRTIGAGRSMSV